MQRSFESENSENEERSAQTTSNGQPAAERQFKRFKSAVEEQRNTQSLAAFAHGFKKIASPRRKMPAQNHHSDVDTSPGVNE